jgi:hypothetical protein
MDQLVDKKTLDMTDLHSISSTGVVSSKLKIAKIAPILKAADASDINNYRPIYLLSSFSKILEKFIQNKLTHYLDSHNLITSQHFGFRSDHSTAHPMTLLLNRVMTALNDKQYSIIIFCDLKKAFNTCNHDILVKKLYKLGIRNTELEWFRSYLTNRQQS